MITEAGRPCGRSDALRLAEERADIVAIDICKDIEGLLPALSTPDDLAETARQVEERKRRVATFEADVRDQNMVTEAVIRESKS